MMHVSVVHLKAPMSDRKAYLESEAKRLQKAIDDAEELRHQKAERQQQRDKSLKTGKTSKNPSKKSGCRLKGFLIITAVIIIISVALIAMVTIDEDMPVSPSDTTQADTTQADTIQETIPTTEPTSRPSTKPTMTEPNIDNASSPEERIDLKTERARKALSTRVSADHESAIKYLYILGEDLDGLDLSCQTLGIWDSNAQICNLRPNFLNTFLVGTQADPRDLTNGIFSHVDFGYSNFMHTNLSDSDFDDAILQYANLSQTSLEDTRFERADLTNAKLDGADLENANFQHANISGASFFGTSNLSVSMFSSAWAWSDNLPRDLPNSITGPMVCNASGRNEYQARRRLGLPLNC